MPRSARLEAPALALDAILECLYTDKPAARGIAARGLETASHDKGPAHRVRSEGAAVLSSLVLLRWLARAA